MYISLSFVLTSLLQFKEDQYRLGYPVEQQNDACLVQL